MRTQSSLRLKIARNDREQLDAEPERDPRF